jgi:hypothetical protein
MIANFWNTKRQSKATESSFKQNIITDTNTYLTPSKETAATIGLLDVKEQIKATNGLLKTHEHKTAIIGLLAINTPMEATTGLLHLQQETTAAIGLTETNMNQLEQTQLLSNRSMTNTSTTTMNIHHTKTFLLDEKGHRKPSSIPFHTLFHGDFRSSTKGRANYSTMQGGGTCGCFFEPISVVRYPSAICKRIQHSLAASLTGRNSSKEMMYHNKKHADKITLKELVPCLNVGY